MNPTGPSYGQHYLCWSLLWFSQYRLDNSMEAVLADCASFLRVTRLSGTLLLQLSFLKEKLISGLKNHIPTQFNHACVELTPCIAEIGRLCYQVSDLLEIDFRQQLTKSRPRLGPFR